MQPGAGRVRVSVRRPCPWRRQSAMGAKWRQATAFFFIQVLTWKEQNRPSTTNGSAKKQRRRLPSQRSSGPHFSVQLITKGPYYKAIKQETGKRHPQLKPDPCRLSRRQLDSSPSFPGFSVVSLEELLSWSPFNLMWIGFFMHNKEMNSTHSIRGRHFGTFPCTCKHEVIPSWKGNTTQQKQWASTRSEQLNTESLKPPCSP